MSFRLDHAHSLSLEDARARIKALCEYLSNKHGIGVSWSGENEAKISGKYLIVTIQGAVTVEPKTVRFEGKDPGMLWRGRAKDYLEHKLKTYLEPSTRLDALPRR